MGKIIKYSSLFLGILISVVFLVRYFWGETNTTLYQIFKEESDGYFINKILGFVPENYKNRYSRITLEEVNGIKIINLVDQHSPIEANFILLQQDEKEYFLKAYPFNLIQSSNKNEVDWNNYVSRLINTNVLNKYIQEKGLSSKENIFRGYCQFIANPTSESSYQIIKSRSDIDSLILQQPIDQAESIMNLGYNIINADTVNFEASPEVYYCWFANHGLIKFNFKFDGSKIMEVKSIRLGYLGNEFPTCC